MKSFRVLVGYLLVIYVDCSRRGKRQVFCPDPFQNVPNVCQQNPQHTTYFIHPTDDTKFLQCDLFGRMYIVQCPRGETFHPAIEACRQVTHATLPVPASIQPPTAAPSASLCQNVNPIGGPVFYAVPSDNTQYVECDSFGHFAVRQCQAGQIWDQKLTSCVYVITAATQAPVFPTAGPSTSLTNPCTPQALAMKKYYFAHPDPHKFLQCDDWGTLYINTCPSGLIYNAYSEVCTSTNPGIVGK